MGIEVITMNIQRYGKDLWVNKRDDDEGGGNNRCDELPKENSRMYE